MAEASESDSPNSERFREMFLDLLEMQIRYDYLMEEKMQNDAHLQAENDALRSELLRRDTEREAMQAEIRQLRQELFMQRSSTKEKSSQATQTAPVGALLSTDVISADPALGVQSAEVAGEACHSGTAAPMKPETSARRKERSFTAKFNWSYEDDITLLNALIDVWKEWEDPNERPPERDILSTVNTRCGNRFPPTIRHHLNGLIRKYVGKDIKDAKKNFTEYKTLLGHIRDKMLLERSKSEESESKSTLEIKRRWVHKH